MSDRYDPDQDPVRVQRYPVPEYPGRNIKPVDDEASPGAAADLGRWTADVERWTASAELLDLPPSWPRRELWPERLLAVSLAVVALCVLAGTVGLFWAGWQALEAFQGLQAWMRQLADVWAASEPAPYCDPTVEVC